MWTWSEVNRDKYYNVIWKLEECLNVDINDYEMNGASPYVMEVEFEVDPLFPERITVWFDGTGVRATCRHIRVSVEERGE